MLVLAFILWFGYIQLALVQIHVTKMVKWFGFTSTIERRCWIYVWDKMFKSGTLWIERFRFQLMHFASKNTTCLGYLLRFLNCQFCTIITHNKNSFRSQKQFCFRATTNYMRRQEIGLGVIGYFYKIFVYIYIYSIYYLYCLVCRGKATVKNYQL